LTAVKVFLIPYDFSDMPPMTKTFLRQKSYITPSESPRGRSRHTTCVVSPTSPESSLSPSKAWDTFTSSPSTSFDNASSTPASSSTYSSGTSSSRANPPQKLLRYAVHLHFICPKPKRIYLHRTIRAVFTPRAPDSSEKLDIFSEGPEDPKYISMSDNETSLLGGV
jgi:hypothetical protein